MNTTRKISPVGIFALVVFQSLEVCRATELFVTPDGAGAKDGTTWENAFDQSQFTAAVNERMQAGDQMNVGGGTYHSFSLSVRSGGQDGKVKRIVGVDRGSGLPVFTGSWNADKPTSGMTALRIEPGVSHFTFQALRFKGYVFCIVTSPDSKDGGHKGLIFDDVDMEKCRHGFYLSDCDDLKLTGCDLKRYTKHGFRFDQGCDGVELKKCTADCSESDPVWEKKTELFPFGFILNDGGMPNTHFVFEDCVSRNNMMPDQKGRYKNGDGFVIEGNTRDVTFRRCRSLRNQDGGFDLKVPDVKLSDCVAVGNKRGFRIWTTGTLTNCFAGWDITGFWCNGGPVDATHCTIHAATSFAVMGDDLATLPITLRGCIVSAASGATTFEPTGRKVVLENSVVFGPKQTGANPEYVHPAPNWNGTGDAMNSRAFPDKGYSSAR